MSDPAGGRGPRLPYIDPAEVAPALRAELEQLPFDGMLQTVAHARSLFAPWRALTAAILSETELPPDLRQVAILRVAGLSTGAEYVEADQVEISQALGVEEERIEAALAGTATSGDDGLVLRFTEGVVVDGAPDQLTWEEVAGRFSPQEIVELLMTIGQYMTLCRIAATVGVPPQPPSGPGVVDALRQASS
jgi:4-carboxymuconolactone decarboxylase